MDSIGTHALLALHVLALQVQLAATSTACKAAAQAQRNRRHATSALGMTLNTLISFYKAHRPMGIKVAAGSQRAAWGLAAACHCVCAAS